MLTLYTGSFFRRDQLWPELDQILRDEDDMISVSTPYTAAINEYRVVIHDSLDTPYEDKQLNGANGNLSYDIHHPCMCVFIVITLLFIQLLCLYDFQLLIAHAELLLRFKKSFTNLNPIVHAFTWNLIFLEQASSKLFFFLFLM